MGGKYPSSDYSFFFLTLKIDRNGKCYQKEIEFSNYGQSKGSKNSTHRRFVDLGANPGEGLSSDWPKWAGSNGKAAFSIRKFIQIDELYLNKIPSIIEFKHIILLPSRTARLQ